jgi:hypothetical protein
MLKKIIELFSIPIMLLNMGGGIVGGIWLAVLGEWRLIGIGIFLLLTFHWVLSILVLLNIPVAGIGIYLTKKNNPLRHLFVFLSQFYINLLIVGTCAFAFWLCSSFYTGNIDIGYTPYLLWSWGMALGPWQYFASKEPENEFTAITIFSASVFYLLFLISMFISLLLALIMIGIFGLVQLIMLPIVNVYMANKMSDDY